jgi:hypothetical protein
LPFLTSNSALAGSICSAFHGSPAPLLKVLLLISSPFAATAYAASSMHQEIINTNADKNKIFLIEKIFLIAISLKNLLLLSFLPLQNKCVHGKIAFAVSFE